MPVIFGHWMIYRLVVMALILSCVPGCPLGGFIWAKMYTETDSIVLKDLSPGVLDIAADVGKSMGLNAQKTSRTLLILTSGGGSTIGSYFATGLTGFIEQVTISVSVVESEKKLDINTNVTSNLGDPQEIAERLTSEFKSRLVDKIKQSKGDASLQ
jgi:hypothetical protein